MLQPVSAHSLCACSWLSLILEEPRLPGGWGWGAVCALPLSDPVELLPGGIVVFYLFETLWERAQQNPRWCRFAQEEAGLNWGKGPAVLGALLQGADRIPEHVTPR